MLRCLFWGISSKQQRRTLKNDAYTSNFQPVNSDLGPFREKKDYGLIFCVFVLIAKLSVVAFCPSRDLRSAKVRTDTKKPPGLDKGTLSSFLFFPVQPFLSILGAGPQQGYPWFLHRFMNLDNPWIIHG